MALFLLSTFHTCISESVISTYGIKASGMEKRIFIHLMEGDIESMQDPEEKLREGNSKPERRAPETELSNPALIPSPSRAKCPTADPVAIAAIC